MSSWLLLLTALRLPGNQTNLEEAFVIVINSFVMSDEERSAPALPV